MRSPYHIDVAEYKCKLECELFGIDDIFAGGISALGGIVSNIFAGSRQKEQEKFAAQQAQQQMDFQERMSSTAYQRGMADMKAAGLNPILAYQKGGASSPTGAMGTTTAAPVTDILQPAVATAMQRQRLSAELDNMRETNYNIKADTMKKTAETTATTEDAARIASDRRIKDQVLVAATAEAAKARTDEEFWNSPAGRMARLLGLGGREAAGAISPITDVIRSGAGAVGTFQRRWEGLHDRGY